ncbi:site-2 protease family protein [Engelhardtia mirabilis]|uniref:Zinc metalloprotease n=1 Tax=Engelhardtia mirabilis TaxID=2528011 RepID=A0A518BH94_9BACT|nr:Putative zinc metalloprotease Rip3 [Planctomycetes bacterium Pla133]QDV00673.1 Putative zinc metalloprotease Rip3 [Planctomycetes bacterium Pla86]
MTGPQTTPTPEPRPTSSSARSGGTSKRAAGRPAIPLGRLFGIEIGLDWSWLFIFLLITFSLAQGFAHGESWSPAQAWSAGLLASLLFFASILLHELGHSVTSQALGLPVRSITLFIFGGLARLSGEPERPRDEFLIAAAGPAVSVLLGLGFLGAAALLGGDAGAAGVLGVVFGWLGTTNLVLAAFNLVPGFPLDGGRLLRAAVWRVTGDFDRATLAASAVGSLFAYLLIGGGIVIALFFGALFNGLWLAFIGWFLLSAAQGSARSVLMERELGGVSVANAMEPVEPAVDGDASLDEALEDVVLSQGRRAFFVAERGQVEGLVTLHQIKEVPRAQRAAARVRDVMLGLSDLVTVSEDASVWDALKLLGEAGVNQVPVVRGGQVVGLLTRGRILAILENARELGDTRGQATHRARPEVDPHPARPRHV